MTPGKFIEIFDTIAEAPGGIERLRELVLQLAVRGRLVPQDGGEEPPISLIEGNAKKKRFLVSQGKISKPKSLPCLSSDEVPFYVPEAWQWIRLGDVALVVMGNSPPGSSYNEQGFGVPLINGPVEFSAGSFGLTICRKHTTEPNQMCMTGDILICVRGATTGRTNIAAFDACIGRGVALVRAWDAQRYVNLYLWHVGKELLAAGKGTTFPSISYADLAGKPLPLPPLAEQHRIVAKVDELMGLIDRLEAARRSREVVRTAGRDSALAALRNAATFEESETAWKRIAGGMDDLFTDPADLTPLRETVLQLGVRGRLVPQNSGEKPATALLERISANNKLKPERPLSPINEANVPWRLPGSWKWVRLKQIVNFTTGKTPPTKDASYWSDEGGHPWVSIADMDHFRIISETKRRVTTKAAAEVFRCPPVFSGTTLMSFKLTIGKIAKLGVDAYHNEGIIALYPVIDEMDTYLFHFMPLFSSGGSSKEAIKGKTLNSNSLSHLLVALPPLAEQHRIVAKVDELMGLIDRLEQHLVDKREYHEAFAAAVNQSKGME